MLSASSAVQIGLLRVFSRDFLFRQTPFVPKRGTNTMRTAAPLSGASRIRQWGSLKATGFSPNIFRPKLTLAFIPRANADSN
jgi:hypothetical protein